MRYFARLSSAKTRWPDDRDPVTDDMRVKARKDFARRPNDDDGVSIFEVCSARRGDLERVVAAAVLQRTRARRAASGHETASALRRSAASAVPGTGAPSGSGCIIWTSGRKNKSTPR